VSKVEAADLGNNSLHRPASAKEALNELAARLLMNCVREVGPEAAGGDILGRGLQVWRPAE